MDLTIFVSGFTDKFKSEARFPAPLALEDIPETERAEIELVPGRDLNFEQVRREEQAKKRKHRGRHGDFC